VTYREPDRARLQELEEERQRAREELAREQAADRALLAQLRTRSLRPGLALLIGFMAPFSIMLVGATARHSFPYLIVPLLASGWVSALIAIFGGASAYRETGSSRSVLTLMAAGGALLWTAFCGVLLAMLTQG
jgi:hypothetical protein